MPDWEQLLEAIDDARPPELAGYAVEGLIGERGQSAVFRGRDPQGRPVAIKRWKVASPRAEREVRALAQVQHPGVVRVRELATDGATGLPCVVMELVDGRPLLADAPRLDPAAAVEVARRVALALEAVHAQGLVHRDVKPDNVLLTSAGPVLVDFGVVKELAPPPDLRTTRTNAPAPGTRPYMAPEQLDPSAGRVGPASDLYALGVTLYQCLTGALPFESDALYERRTRDVWRAPAPGARVAGVDPALRARVSACLAFAPEGRPDSAAALAATLGAWRRRRARPWRGALLGLGGVAALTAAAVWSAGEPPAPAPVAAVAALHTLTLQPGPLEGRDTYVDGVGWYRNDNFGAEQALRVGHRPPQSGQTGEQRGFLAFDLTRLPAGAEVEAATLTLTCIQSLYLDEASTLEVHAVRESGARTPWREGTGLHDALLDGVAWSGTFAGQGSDPRTASARPELDPPDVEPAALDRATVRPFAGEPFTVTLDVSAAVRAWQRDPASNLGLRLALAAEDRTSGCKVFATSDAVDPAARPRLEVRYRGAPAASAPDLAQQRARARAAARRLLADAEAEASRGAWDRALQACTRAIEAAPFWGAPFLARAGCAERLGLPTLARLDAGRAVGCLEPALGPPAYAAVARLGLGLENPLVRRQALGALTLLALSQRMDPEVSALYQGAARLGVFAPDAPASWAPYAEGQLLTLEASRARAPEAGADVLFVLALLRAARGAPEAAADYARACAADPGHPLAGIDPPLGPGEVRLLGTPERCADWTRALLAVGQVPAARAELDAARAAWPEDPELRALAACLGD